MTDFGTVNYIIATQTLFVEIYNPGVGLGSCVLSLNTKLNICEYEAGTMHPLGFGLGFCLIL
jgi:hypothetical protein